MFIFKIFIYLLNISPIESSESETLNEVSVILTTAEVHNNSNEYDNTIDSNKHLQKTDFDYMKKTSNSNNKHFDYVDEITSFLSQENEESIKNDDFNLDIDDEIQKLMCCKNNQTHKLKKKLDLFFISLMILIFILFALLIVLCVKLIIRFCY